MLTNQIQRLYINKPLSDRRTRAQRRRATRAWQARRRSLRSVIESVLGKHWLQKIPTSASASRGSGGEHRGEEGEEEDEKVEDEGTKTAVSKMAGGGEEGEQRLHYYQVPDSSTSLGLGCVVLGRLKT